MPGCRESNPAESRTLENGSEPRADPRPCAGGPKGVVDPPERVDEDRNGRLAARRADIEVNRDEFAAGTKVVQVMAHNFDRVRNVKEQQPADDGVKRRGRAPLPRVTFFEREMSGPSLLRPFARDGDCIGGPIDSQNGAGRSDDLAHDLRNMAQPGAEVEHACSRRETRGLQEQASGTVDRRGLTIESRELFRVMAKGVAILRRLMAVHDGLRVSPGARPR